MADQINIEVAFALPEKHSLLTVTLDLGATIEQAIEASGI